MYLTICENQRKDLDTVFSLLDTWKAKHNAAVRHKPFHTAAEHKKATSRWLYYHLEGGR